MFRTFLTGAALLAATGVAGAQTITTDHLAALDANGDGAVTSDELGTFMDQAFRTIDADGDEAITPVEAGTVIPPETFGATDTDKDGRITREEFDNAAAADFSGADKDGDGSLN